MPARTIEIVVHQNPSTKGEEANQVAVVVPAEMELAEGDSLVFHNRSYSAVKIWIPRPWADAKEQPEFIELAPNPAGKDEIGKSAAVRVRNAKQEDQREIAYQVYAVDLDEFAVGNSPPRMKLPPPPP